MAKNDLVSRAVELELGTAEDLEKFTVSELTELLADVTTEPPGPVPAPEPEKDPDLGDMKITTVADLVKAGRLKSAG